VRFLGGLKRKRTCVDTTIARAIDDDKSEIEHDKFEIEHDKDDKENQKRKSQKFISK